MTGISTVLNHSCTSSARKSVVEQPVHYPYWWGTNMSSMISIIHSFVYNSMLLNMTSVREIGCNTYIWGYSWLDTAYTNLILSLWNATLLYWVSFYITNYLLWLHRIYTCLSCKLYLIIPLTCILSSHDFFYYVVIIYYNFLEEGVFDAANILRNSVYSIYQYI